MRGNASFSAVQVKKRKKCGWEKSNSGMIPAKPQQNTRFFPGTLVISGECRYNGAMPGIIFSRVILLPDSSAPPACAFLILEMV
jgi:hypothetical protein